MKTIAVVVAFGVLGLSIACRNDRSLGETHSTAPASGESADSGFDQAPTAPPIRPGATAHGEDELFRYVVDHVDDKQQKIYLTPLAGLPEDAGLGRQDVAGRELVFTFLQVRALAPEVLGHDNLRDFAPRGAHVQVVRDGAGNVTRLIFEKAD